MEVFDDDHRGFDLEIAAHLNELTRSSNTSVPIDNGTIFHMDLSDQEHVLTENGTYVDRGMINIDHKVPEEVLNLGPNNIVPLDDITSPRSILQEGSNIFIVYSSLAGPEVRLFMVNSSNNGSTWSTPILLHKEKVNTVKASLYSWNGKIIVAYSPTKVDTPEGNKLFIIEAPINNPILLLDSTRLEVRKGFISDFEMVDDGNHLYIAVKSSKSLNCMLYKYDGHIISNSIEVIPDGVCRNFSLIPSRNDVNSVLKLFFINEMEASNPSKNCSLYMIVSNNSGETFGPPIAIFPIDHNSTQVEAITSGSSIKVFVNVPGSEELQYCFSTDNGETWIDGIIRSRERGNTSLVSFGTDLSIGNMEGRTFISFLSSSDRLYYMSFEPEYPMNHTIIEARRIDSGISKDISMTSEGNNVRYLSSVEGQEHVIIKRIGVFRSEGSVISQEVSPPILGLWEDIGLTAYIPSNTSLDMVILDGRTGGRIFPSEGWIDISTLGRGMINGRVYDHKLILNGTWEGSASYPSIMLKFRLLSNGNSTPSIGSIALNYSTKLPYSDDLQSLLFIKECEADWESGYINMTEGENIQHFRTEPIEKESGKWPDHLSLQIVGIDEDNRVYIGLIDPTTGDPFQGFSKMDCSLRNGFKEQNMYIPFWNGSALGDLEEEVESIIIEVVMTCDHAMGRLSIRGIGTMNDASPSVISYNIHPGPKIKRTEILRIYAAFEDDIQRQDDLSVELKHKPPGQDLWTSVSISGPTFNDSVWIWEIEILPNTSIGTWDIKILYRDMLERRNITVFEAGSYEVINNPPRTPEICLMVESPTTIDDIEIAIFDGAWDVETPFEELLFTYEWYVDNELFKIIENTTSTTSIIDHDHTHKDQVWNVLVSLWDGNERSNTSEIKVMVRNTEPSIKDQSVKTITIFEDDRTNSFRPSDLIFDQDGDGLEYKVSTSVGIELSKVGEGYLILPDKDWSGSSWIDVTARDGTASIDLRIPVEVLSVNDQPEGVEILSPLNKTIVGPGYKWHFKGNYHDPDVPYGQKVNSSWEINGDHIGIGLELNNFILPPGIHQVTFIVDDTSGEIKTDTVVLIVLGSNDQGSEQDTPIEEVGINDDNMDEITSYIFMISVIAFFLLVGILLIAILRKSNVKPLNRKYLPAPLLQDQNKDVKKDKRQNYYRSRDAVPPQLPPIASERNKIGQWEKLMSRQRTWRRRKRDRYSQNGRKISAKKLESDWIYNPYSTKTMKGREGVEKLAEYDSFYIRPEKPYRY